MKKQKRKTKKKEKKRKHQFLLGRPVRKIAQQGGARQLVPDAKGVK
jgi:hypothetical protein